MKRTFLPNTTVAAVKDQVYSNLEQEAVVLHFKKGIYYGMNSMGSFIWGTIQAPRAIHEIEEAIHKEYAVDGSRCQQELFRFLRELAQRDLIEIRPGTTP
ncbi:MAG: PqqD family protein [Candidatus Omnitrophica bacterium]|nr:PqqD family protein [Candidatus Omnitrophota bacterium]